MAYPGRRRRVMIFDCTNCLYEHREDCPDCRLPDKINGIPTGWRGKHITKNERRKPKFQVR